MVQQQSAIRHEIDRTNARFVEAFNRGDATSAVAVYTDDATILPPGSPMISGRAAIEQFWRGAMQIGVRAVSLETLELIEAGDTAHEIGSATLTIQPEGGETTTDTAKYVVVWQRDPGGSWKWAIDIWNSNA